MLNRTRSRSSGQKAEAVLTRAQVSILLRKHPLLAGLLATGAGFACGPGSGASPERATSSGRVLYCVRGKGRVESRGRLFVIGKGDVLIVPPGVSPRLHSYAASPWALHWVDATGTRLSDYLLDLQAGADVSVLRIGEEPQVMRLFCEILRLLRLGSGYLQALEASHALGYLLSIVIQKRHASASQDTNTIQKVAECIVYMSEHLDQPLRISGLARAAGLSPDYFTQVFKAQTGCSPRQYLHLLRMHRASQLLRGSEWAVKKVSASIGYQDPFHFSRQFKAFHGLSPTEFRGGPGA